ncbi:MAG: metal ABC transporter permease [Deltaproteobacteria bacterium]|nr:metal ABC transporter permease [Deltaproteobacteria bacterium]
MSDQSAWWVWPLLAALVLISIHTYLGLHVIRRKVLFVDLALAQIAALGSTVAFLFGYELSDPITTWISLMFAIGGAWVFSVTRSRKERVPHEAIIGLSYAIAAAGSILLSAENPHGAEHLRDIVAGSILVVTPAEVRNAAILYALIGAAHYFFRGPLKRVSEDPDGAVAEGIAVQRWDFFFYVSFALVITVSVHIAGVLLVFCLLIAPAVCAAIFAESPRVRLLVGWGTSAVAAIGGFALSGQYDWPPAPSVIAVFSAILVLAGLWSYVVRSDRRGRALLNVAVGSLILISLGVGGREALRRGVGRAEGGEHEDHAHHHEDAKGEVANPGKGPLVDLDDPSPEVVEKAAEELERVGDARAALALEAALGRPRDDEWVRLSLARAAARCGSKAGVDALFELANADARAVADEARRLAAELTGQVGPSDAGARAGDEEANWKASRESARFDKKARVFTSRPPI